MTGCEVDDAETTHPEPDRTGGVDAVVVRAAVGHGVTHRPQHPRVNPGTICKLQDSCNAAHLFWTSFSESKAFALLLS